MERLRRAAAVIRDAVRPSRHPTSETGPLPTSSALGRPRGARPPEPEIGAPPAGPDSADRGGRRIPSFAAPPPAAMGLAGAGRGWLRSRRPSWLPSSHLGHRRCRTRPPDRRTGRGDRRAANVAAWTIRVDGQADARHVAMRPTTADGGSTGTLIFSPSSTDVVVVAEGLATRRRARNTAAGSRRTVSGTDRPDVPRQGLAYWVGTAPALGGVGDGSTFGDRDRPDRRRLRRDRILTGRRDGAGQPTSGPREPDAPTTRRPPRTLKPSVCRNNGPLGRDPANGSPRQCRPEGEVTAMFDEHRAGLRPPQHDHDDGPRPALASGGRRRVAARAGRLDDRRRGGDGQAGGRARRSRGPVRPGRRGRPLGRHGRSGTGRDQRPRPARVHRRQRAGAALRRRPVRRGDHRVRPPQSVRLRGGFPGDATCRPTGRPGRLPGADDAAAAPGGAGSTGRVFRRGAPLAGSIAGRREMYDRTCLPRSTAFPTPSSWPS